MSVNLKLTVESFMCGDYKNYMKKKGGASTVFRYLVFLTLILHLPVVSWAACTGSSPTWTSSPDQASVASCISQADAGDTINVSAGEETWTSGVTINKALTLIGAGKTLTHINSTITGGLFKISLSSDVPVRISGFDINSGVNNNTNKYAIYIQGKTDGSFAYTKIRIDNNKIEKGKRAVYAYGWVESLIDHNEFLNCDIAVGLTGDRHNTWDRAIEAGTIHALFIENNTFTANNNCDKYLNQQIYHYMGSRSVIRYNTFDLTAQTAYDNLTFDSHGNGSYYPGVDRGQPILEIYNNDIDIHHSYRMFHFRGGSFLIYNNTVTTVTGSFSMISATEEEGWQTAFFNPLDTVWPAEDQVMNSFIWDNTFNGDAVTSLTFYTTERDSVFMQEDRDYFMHAPESSGGSESYTDRQGASGRGSDGTMTFTSSGANAYYPYTAYTYPHPLVVGDLAGGTEGGAPSSPKDLEIK